MCQFWASRVCWHNALVAAQPETRYTRHNDGYLAYQVVGEGPLDLVLIETWTHHLELWWEFPEVARQLRRLAAIGRLIRFDRRGTGLSDPLPASGLPGLAGQAGDVCAVMDAAGSQQAAILGFYEGGALAIQLAATYPERCRALVLYGAYARLSWAPDYQFAEPEAAIADRSRQWAGMVAAGDLAVADLMAPSRSGDAVFAAQFMRLSRAAIAPGVLERYYRQTAALDVRDRLGQIRAPTLVLHRAGDGVVPSGHGRYLADHITGARYVELPGDDHASFTGNADELVDEIAEFLIGTRGGTDPGRRLVVVLFTDIVDSTKQAAGLGDREWRSRLDEHDAIVRRQFARFDGTEIDHTGDGFLACFGTPTAAIRAAAAINEALSATGIAIRAGVHAGEVEVRGDRIGGLAVHIGARVSATAGPGEILVSSTVREILAGSRFRFTDRGEHVLKGVPGKWKLFAVKMNNCAARSPR
jgi:pimeloyl-ACP methyl ester carboxylesterase